MTPHEAIALDETPDAAPAVQEAATGRWRRRKRLPQLWAWLGTVAYMGFLWAVRSIL